jgi:hypothetical protein
MAPMSFWARPPVLKEKEKIEKKVGCCLLKDLPILPDRTEEHKISILCQLRVPQLTHSLTHYIHIASIGSAQYVASPRELRLIPVAAVDACMQPCALAPAFF